MSKILDTMLVQLGSSSTWRGLILLGTAIGIHFDESQAAAIASAGLALVGLINVFRRS